MTYLLDTNTCIYALKGSPPEVVERLRECKPGEVSVSIITFAELLFGAAKSAHPKRNRLAVEAFLGDLTVLDFDLAAAEAYATIRLHLERAGTPISERDQLIVAAAMSRALTVITHNVREFARVKGLKVEDWHPEEDER